VTYGVGDLFDVHPGVAEHAHERVPLLPRCPVRADPGAPAQRIELLAHVLRPPGRTRAVAEHDRQPREGTRNDMLNRSAFALGQLVGAGMLDGESMAAVLEDAGQRIGLDADEVRRSIASGLRAGARCPRGGRA
jgi:hypothetical protein